MTTFREVNGLVIDLKKNEPYRRHVRVFFTSDNNGETISFASGTTLILVGYKEVEDIVREERQHQYGDGHFILESKEE